MARIRSIKPELRTSLVVANWPREVRYAWVLLWGYLDDHGRGVDDLRLIVADLFPLDRDVTEKKMDGWLKRMCVGPLCRYALDGRHFIHAVNWTEHQRPSHPTPSKWPPCPEHDPDLFGEWRTLHPEPAKSSRKAPEKPANVERAIPADFVPSRAPDEQGAGSREQGAGFSEVPEVGPSTHVGGAIPNEGPSDPADELVAEIRRLRPDWKPWLIRGAFDRALAKPSVSFDRAADAFRAVAAAPDSRQPIRVIENGWWWDESDTRRAEALNRYGEAS
jgi:hypothetical protein